MQQVLHVKNVSPSRGSLDVLHSTVRLDPGVPLQQDHGPTDLHEDKKILCED